MKEILADMLFNDFLPIKIISWIILLMLLFLILYGLFYAIETIGVDERQTSAMVSDKQYHKPYTTTTVVSNGNGGFTPITNYHPEKYELILKSSVGVGSSNVYRGFYDKINIGDYVEIKYKLGRLSGSFYITKVLGE